MMSTLPGLGVSENTGRLPLSWPSVAGKISR